MGNNRTLSIKDISLCKVCSKVMNNSEIIRNEKKYYQIYNNKCSRLSINDIQIHMIYNN